MTVLELYRALDAQIPTSLSCPWDNDGLMVCPNSEKKVKKVLFALDATEESIGEAIRWGGDVLISHHPLLFRPLASVTPMELTGRRVLTALAGELSVFSFHTRLDALEGGVNDALAEKLGLVVTRSFGDEEAPTLGRICELPTPVDATTFAASVKRSLSAPAVRLTGGRPVRRVALVGGDGKGFIAPAIAAGADTLLTGDASYNAAIDAVALGLNVIEAGHYHTEAPVLSVLARMVGKACPAECRVLDGAPMHII